MTIRCLLITLGGSAAGNRRLLVTAAIVLLAPLVAGCPGLADFSTPLSGGYFLHRTNSIDIIVAPDSWNDTVPIIPAKVIELAHRDPWVLAKQLRLGRAAAGEPDGEPLNHTAAFWILNVRTPQVWGPLSSAEFTALRLELGIDSQLRLEDVYRYAPRWW